MEKEIIISRSQLVEIGGGFRIPDVMAQSGASLVEVGTTNRTYLRDYEAAISERTVALMRVHSSNFRITGFTHQATLAELSKAAREHGLLLLDDLGSGTLIDTQPFGLTHEPTVQDSITQGADIVTFSGDKLLGGPQAGIIVGKSSLIERLRHFPLTRALRVDKTTIAGIQTNLLHYLKGEALSKIPIWRMISMPAAEISKRAHGVLEALGASAAHCDILSGQSMVGGGSLPEQGLPTALLALPTAPGECKGALATTGGASCARLSAALRTGQPSIVARVQNDRVVLDLRTVLPQQDQALITRLRELL